MEALQYRALEYFRAGRYRECLGLIDKAIDQGQKGSRSLDPGVDVSLLDQKVACLTRLGKMDQAIAQSKKMIQIASEDSRGYLRIGALLEQKGDLLMAYRVYKRASQKLASNDANYQILSSKARVLSTQVITNEDRRTAKTKRDPFAAFPYEILHLILKQLPLSEIVKCMSVSKLWRDFITHDAWLWASETMDFSKAKKRPGAKTVLRYINYAIGRNQHVRIRRLKLGFMNTKDEAELFTKLSRNCSHRIDEVEFGRLSPTALERLNHGEMFKGLKILKVQTALPVAYAYYMLHKILSLEQLHWTETPTMRSNLVETIRKIRLLGPLSGPRKLTFLALTAASSSSIPEQEVVDMLRQSSSLRGIKLLTIPITEAIVAALNGIAADRDFEQLHLTDFTASPYLLKAKSVSSLRVAGLRDEIPQTFELPVTTTLNLSGLRLSSKQNLGKVLSRFQGSQELISLHLTFMVPTHEKFGKGDYGRFVGQKFPRLEFLCLRANDSIDDMIIEEMVSCHPKLKYVDLRMTKVTGAGIVRLVKLGVKHLSITECECRPETLAWLRQQQDVALYDDLCTRIDT
ncbi:hypothetical protein TRVA0_006S04126 [Trichomonascus vanleenenianus]|uniref:uncharacterized protein n=1 Tax=Trichomonascus vanleenenianus TaxID=2268995 RepID=UPI003ECA11D9